MEVLVLSCGTGGGHNAAGKAVAEELTRRGHRAVFMNAFGLTQNHAETIINNIYIKIAQRTPKLFGVIYFLGNAYRKLPIKSPVYWGNGKMAGCLGRYLSENHYDAIVMSHLFPAQTITKMKRDGIQKLPLTVLVETDYACIPFTEETDCDYCVIPSKELEEEFISYGIPKEKLLPFGIPVRRGFADREPKETVRERLNLEKDGDYILLSGGSIGAGSMKTAIRTLLPFLQEDDRHRLIVICGNNDKLYHKLQKKYGSNERIVLMQQTECMADYMKACDVFITKPGGLSSTEAAAAGVPLILISPIPGCELINMKFFARHHMCAAVRYQKRGKFPALIPAIEELHSKEIVELMGKAQEETINARAAQDLCDFLEKKVKEREQQPD